ITGEEPTVTFINNTVAYNKGYGVTTQSASVWMRNSIIWNNSGVDVNSELVNPEAAGDGPELSDSVVRTMNLNGDHVRRAWAVDPQFVWVAKGDFRLKNTSPAIGTGNDDSWQEGACDPEELAGLPRALGRSIDIGAAEYLSPGTRRACAFETDKNACYVKETLMERPI
ncbi:MAG: hypothetical protein ACREJQ_00565, partial [bacterium]